MIGAPSPFLLRPGVCVVHVSRAEVPSDRQPELVVVLLFCDKSTYLPCIVLLGTTPVQLCCSRTRPEMSSRVLLAVSNPGVVRIGFFTLKDTCAVFVGQIRRAKVCRSATFPALLDPRSTWRSIPSTPHGTGWVISR